MAPSTPAPRFDGGTSQETAIEVLNALAHPLRLELLAQVAARGPVCACHLEADLGESQPQISKHLAVLYRAGVLERRREGRWVYFTVNESTLDAAQESIDGLRAAMHRPHLTERC